MMKDKFREFSDNFKSQGEKTSSLTEALNSGLSKLEESMSRYESNNTKIEEKIYVFTNTVEEINRKHDTLDSTVKDLGIKVAQIDEIQKELLEKQNQVIRLSDELKEKMAIIESTNRRLEFLEEWREAVKAQDEADELRGRKMNVWIYDLLTTTSGPVPVYEGSPPTSISSLLHRRTMMSLLRLLNNEEREEFRGYACPMNWDGLPLSTPRATDHSLEFIDTHMHLDLSLQNLRLS